MFQIKDLELNFMIKSSYSRQLRNQDFVKKFAEKYDFCYPHELYYGPFISWNHCLSFANAPAYGTQQEGIVIKNQTALEQERGPHILKIVNICYSPFWNSAGMRTVR